MFYWSFFLCSSSRTPTDYGCCGGVSNIILESLDYYSFLLISFLFSLILPFYYFTNPIFLPLFLFVCSPVFWSHFIHYSLCVFYFFWILVQNFLHLFILSLSCYLPLIPFYFEILDQFHYHYLILYQVIPSLLFGLVSGYFSVLLLLVFSLSLLSFIFVWR